ncbi:MAG: hypothetical protein HYS39_03555, partial [Proteobacteria bacterium]|nr:hypothetical protein [Pseudomonadota bacterium]
MVTFLIVILLIGLLIIIGVVFITNRAVNQAEKKKLPPKPQAPPVYQPTKRTPPIGGRFSQQLVLKGYFRVSDLSFSFVKALEFLRTIFKGFNYKYRLPWYLLIGPSEGGKETLLKQAALKFDSTQPNFGLLDAKPPLKWWFFNRGILLQVRGDLFLSKRGVQCEESGWRQILSLLSRYRSARPIDGVILCLPATELYGDSKLTFDELNDRAKFISQKLQAMQQSIGLKLPVYVVLTKCDVISGFQNFCAEIPEENRFNMLGWSNPYALST